MPQETSRTKGQSAVRQTPGAPQQLSVGQVATLGASVWRELTFGLPLAVWNLRRWHRIAEQIPDPTLRADALDALRTKRGFAVGAGLFTILPRRRSSALLEILVALETIIDYLDNVSERHPDVANGKQLHQALVDAVDLSREPHRDYYRLHPASDDGGYLHRLVATCRAGCSQLPSYPAVMPLLVREARRKEVLTLNHDTDPERRDAALRAWAAAEFPDGVDDLAWWEITGAASSSLLSHALLALAVDRNVDQRAVDAVTGAFWPWTDLATTLLDSFIDWHADAASGAHAYLDHYNDPARAIARIRASVAHASSRALQAPRGRRHAVIVGAMAALFLSAPAAAAPSLAPAARAIATDAGALARLLVPVLGVWRMLAHQRS